MNNKNYKSTFILDTRGYSEPVETLIEKLKAIIESAGGKIGGVENLGQKTFSRAVDRSFPAGLYVQVSYEAPTSANASIKEKLRLDRTVDRIFIEVQ